MLADVVVSMLMQRKRYCRHLWRWSSSQLMAVQSEPSSFLALVSWPVWLPRSWSD